MPITYRLQATDPTTHVFDVSVELDAPDAGGQVLRLPAWIPGSYMIRDFSRNIVQIAATSAGVAVELAKVDKSTWQAPAGLAQLSVRYQVYAWDLSVRTAHLDNTHGFFNGTSVFLAVVGQEDQPVDVELVAPAGDSYAAWQVATAMTHVSVDANGYGHYRAADYDELIDHPVEMGTFERITFDACGVLHEVVLTGSYVADSHRIARDLERICRYQIEFFGKPAPVEKYVFMVMVVDSGYGGLEHRASTALLITRDNLPLPGAGAGDDGQPIVSEEYLNFLGLCSHEYFHTWNVKRMKPQRFVPFELEAESYTRLLWFFEGITSYYDDLVLVRCGLIDNDKYLELMGRTITRVYRGSGRLKQSVTDSSFDAWHKFYKQDENAPNAIVSYYAKGALIALCLDAEMRKRSGGKVTLDNLMHALWQRWLDTGNGLEEKEPEVLASELVGELLDAFFEKALYSTEDLPLAEALNVLGCDVLWRARTSPTDRGGVAAKGETASAPAPWFGVNARVVDCKVKVTHVFSGGPAERAGLAPGDELVAMDGFACTAHPDEGLKRHAQQTRVQVHYFRFGVLSETTVAIEAAPLDTAVLTLAEGAEVNWPVSVPGSA